VGIILDVETINEDINNIYFISFFADQINIYNDIYEAKDRLNKVPNVQI
jgi:hypothetical protein